MANQTVQDRLCGIEQASQFVRDLLTKDTNVKRTLV